VVGKSEGRSGRIGPHRVSYGIRNLSLIRGEGVAHHHVLPCGNSVRGETALEEEGDKANREPVGGLREIHRIPNPHWPTLHLPQEGPLVESDILRNNLEETEQVTVEGPENGLAEIINHRDHPGLPFSVLNRHHLPDSALAPGFLKKVPQGPSITKEVLQGKGEILPP